MANLLPQNDQMKLHTEHVRRFQVIVLLEFAATLVVNAVFLFPSFFIVRERARVVEEEFAVASAAAEKREGSYTGAALRSLREKMTILLDAEALRSPTEVFQVVGNVATHEPGISIFSLTFEAKPASTSTLSIRGVSATREGLISFRGLLEETKLFVEVPIPVGSLAKSTDIDFALSIPIAPVKN